MNWEKKREKTSKEEKEKLGFLEEARLQGFIAGSLLILFGLIPQLLGPFL